MVWLNVFNKVIVKQATWFHYIIHDYYHHHHHHRDDVGVVDYDYFLRLIPLHNRQ
jgi:hypothetical protein